MATEVTEWRYIGPGGFHLHGKAGGHEHPRGSEPHLIHFEPSADLAGEQTKEGE